MDDNDKVTKHESYGAAVINRVSGRTYLFGSDAEHHSFIRLSIAHAQTRRSLSTDWMSADSLPIIEVDFSHSAFAEFITSPGIGSGVHCTIRAINGKRMEETPEPEHFTSKFQNEIKETLGTAMKTLDGLQSQLADALLPGNKPLNKKELGVLLNGIQHAVMQVKQNLPYVEDSFRETVEVEVNKAKTEMEGFRDHIITTIGLRAIGARAEQLQGMTDGMPSATVFQLAKANPVAGEPPLQALEAEIEANKKGKK